MNIKKMFLEFLIVISVFLCVSGLDIYLSRSGYLVGGSLIGVLFVLGMFFILAMKSNGHIKINNASIWPLISLWAFFSFLIWVLCSVFFAPDIVSAGLAFFRYCLYMLVAIFIGIIVLMPSYKKYVTAGVIVAILLICGTIWVDVISPKKYFSEGARPAGIMINPNAGAQAATMLLLLAFVLLRSTRSLLIIMGFVAVSVLVTLSRSGFLLLFLCILSGFYLRKEIGFSFNYKFLVSVAVISLFLVGSAFVYFNMVVNLTVLNRLEYMFSDGGFVDLDDPRVQLAKKYFDLWLERPILGFGTASTYSGEFDIKGATHNLYLKILVENGVIGLSFFIISLLCFMFGNCIRSGWGYVLPWCLVAAWGVFANGLLDNRLFYIVIVILSLSPAIMRVNKP
ncbi:O-antigen ligase family protein [Vreelandella profundi]|uniref:O-antigen ligase family protein n=1 Tax=Vreelandella profundi TaxID=2852117 RepID=UPI001EF1600F|nr:O-antigen ligase family protein [Halomonas profundi]